jgi:L-lysine 2,3-aminomutase
MFYRSVSQIAKKLHLPQEEIERLKPIIDRFPMQIPAYYLNLIDPDDPDASSRAVYLWLTAVQDSVVRVLMR